MASFIASQVIAFVIVFLYGSFFEWWFHKYLFHSPKYIKATFKAHALVHHQRYKYEPNSYEWQQGQEKDHIAMDWFALPVFIGVHLPFFIAFQWATGLPVVWGCVASVIAYYTIYEYFHYCMHVPNNRFFEKFRIFKFVKEHHRIHHKYMLQNLNVFFPLADKCLGTYRSAASVAAKAEAVVAAPAAPSVRSNPVKPLRLDESAKS